MYEEFLQYVTDAIKTLNKFEKEHPEDNHMTPYLGRIPVVFDGEINGYLADEIGGVWSYDPLPKPIPYTPKD